jgi:hypothetical protein
MSRSSRSVVSSDMLRISNNRVRQFRLIPKTRERWSSNAARSSALKEDEDEAQQKHRQVDEKERKGQLTSVRVLHLGQKEDTSCVCAIRKQRDVEMERGTKETREFSSREATQLSSSGLTRLFIASRIYHHNISRAKRLSLEGCFGK